jgi:translation elongation factor EF-Tu-like GTPase
MLPRHKIHLELSATDSGGRRGSITDGYMPHLVVEGGNGTFLGVKVVGLTSELKPGGSAQCLVELVYSPNVDYSELVPGARFAVREGPNVVGIGSVLT